MADKEATLLYHVFSLEEEEKENKRLYNFLISVIEKISHLDFNILKIDFKNNISLTIESKELHFYMYSNDISIYQNEDSCDCKLSKDRVLYYLDYVGNLRY